MIDYDALGVLIELFNLSYDESLVIAGKVKGGAIIQPLPLITGRRQKAAQLFFKEYRQ